MNSTTTSPSAPERDLALTAALAALRVELIDLAFDLDRRGQCEAADVATTMAVRLAELLPLKLGGGE